MSVAVPPGSGPPELGSRPDPGPPAVGAPLPRAWAARLEAAGQAHLVAHAATLPEPVRAAFVAETEDVAWERLARTLRVALPPPPPDLRPPEALTLRRQHNEPGLPEASLLDRRVPAGGGQGSHRAPRGRAGVAARPPRAQGDLRARPDPRSHAVRRPARARAGRGATGRSSRARRRARQPRHRGGDARGLRDGALVRARSRARALRAPGRAARPRRRGARDPGGARPPRAGPRRARRPRRPRSSARGRSAGSRASASSS